VDSSNLATWQAKTLYAALRPALGFLYRLQERMEKRGFPPGDPLFRLTANAYDALHSLCIELHCMECESGVGRKRKRSRNINSQGKPTPWLHGEEDLLPRGADSSKSWL
jgi:hypothetical protein